MVAGGLGMTAVSPFGIGSDRVSAMDRSFFDDYYDGALKVLTGLRDTQTVLIEREMRTAYERVKKGGTVYSQITAGHFPTDETALTRTGQPGVFAFLERGAKDDAYDRLKPDDMIITDVIHPGNIRAMKRSIRVVGVTVNYYPFAQTPPGEGYQIEYEGKILRIEDASSVVIDSQMPWYNGLVNARQNPDFPVIPVGGIAQGAVYWMAAAELAALKATRGKGPLGAARSYIDTCIDRAQMVRQDRLKFAAVGSHLADLVIKGGKWWVAGAKALVSDSLSVANGPMVTRSYQAKQVKKDDIVLIATYDSNNPEDIVVARDARAKGAFVVSISPFSMETDSSGPRLYKEVDVAFNSYSPDTWGVVTVKRLERRVCPATGVIGDLILWLLVAEWTDVMAGRDLFPYFWKGIFMKNGTEYNTKTRPLFEARGW
jgi:hypothetical protein